eukprot:IDg2366t1
MESFAFVLAESSFDVVQFRSTDSFDIFASVFESSEGWCDVLPSDRLVGGIKGKEFRIRNKNHLIKMLEQKYGKLKFSLLLDCEPVCRKLPALY